MISSFYQDFTFIPALADDFGHYVLHSSPSSFKMWKKSEGWKTRILKGKRLLSFVDVFDKQNGIYFFIDQMVEEEDDKFTCILDPVRISKQCPPALLNTFEKFLARNVLWALRKVGLSNKVNTKYLWIGNRKLEIEKNIWRQRDLLLIKKTQATIEGRLFLEPDARFRPVNPKISYDQTVFQLSCPKEKNQWAEKTKDVGLLVQIGNTRRQIFREKGIYSWDHPEFLSLVRKYVPYKSYRIIEKMLQLDSSDQNMLLPSDGIRQKLHPDLLTLPEEKLLFIDFETDYQKCIYLCGFVDSERGYRSEWADGIQMETELPLLLRIASIIEQHKKEGGKIVYFYAENIFWKERCQKHDLQELIHIFEDGIDLHKEISSAPILIKGLFNFKLKSIAEKLFSIGKIHIQQPEGCVDGAESIRIAKRWFTQNSPQDKEILENYNEFDCQVLLEITRFLRSL